MALALNDRVKQTGTANTTVSFTLSGSSAGFQSFAVVGDGNTTYYSATDASGNWEVGIGTYSTTGPTLTRTTILSSSNTGSAVTFSGAVEVFVTYPSEKSVNLDGSGNLVFNGSTTTTNLKLGNNLDTNGYSVIGGNYGGNQLVLPVGFGPYLQALYEGNVNIAVGTSGSVAYTSTFDQYGNLKTNSVTQAIEKTTSAAGITTLTPASPHFQILTGTTTQTYKLPDASTLATGTSWIFDNDSTSNLTVTDNTGATVDVVAAGGYSTVFLEANATVAGEWGRFGMLPNEINWGTNSLDLASTVITGGVWNGGTIPTGYGGTGLTSFSSGGALYATSTSALATGTLPITAGGTASTSLAANNVLLGNGTSALQVVAPGTSGNVLTSNGTTWASTAPSSGITVTDDTSTATAIYPTLTSATSGSISGVSVTSTKFKFVPSTGTMTSSNLEASNGMIVNSNTVSANYSIPSGSSALAAGPITVASGVSVTVPSGSRWVIL